MAHIRTSDAKQVETLDAEAVANKLGGEIVKADAANLPATSPSEEFALMAAEFDDGTAAFIEHFGLTMPRLKSDFGRNGKGWVDDLTGEAMNRLRIVILAQPPSRTFWLKSLEETGGGGPPDCKSTNLLADRPDDNVPEPQSAKCSTCPHSQWGEADDGSRIKPPCSEAVNVLAYDLDGERFMWLAFRGTSISPYRKYVSALYSRKLSIFGVETVVTLEDAKRGSFEWLEAHFHIGDPLAVELVRPLRDIARKAMATWETEAEAMAATEARSESVAEEEPF